MALLWEQPVLYLVTIERAWLVLQINLQHK